MRRPPASLRPPTLLARLALVLRELLAAVRSVGMARLVARFATESEAVSAFLRWLLALRGLALRRLLGLSLAVR